MAAPALLWLRQDLRLSDQPALVAACHDGPVIPVYVLDDDGPGDHAMGGASRWWLHHSLTALGKALGAKGSRLILRRGKAAEVLAALAEETGAGAVHAIRHYEPWWIKAEEALAEAVDLCLHDGNQLAPPDSITTGAGKPFKIYTPFWRALSHHMPPDDPIRAPVRIPAPSQWPATESLGSWSLPPAKPDWATGFSDWEPGEEGAHKRLDQFVGEAADYEATRNLPSQDGTSRLSPHLHFGEITPRQIWHRVAEKGGSVRTFLGEIGWREGERWFWDCLVDADYGNNGVNWQWTAGTGVDSNMFPRIMAPLSQSAKFDAADYIREWVPELRDLPDDAIHDPEDAGCRPDDYPEKLIGHKEARERALAAYRKTK